MDYAIELKEVTKKYKLYQNQKERFLDLFFSKDYGEDFQALRGVDFQAKKGETIGFVGVNGSGKSTLLNIIAGIVPETTGTVSVNGDVSIIAVSSGLKGDLSGRENIELKCLMLGFTQDQISRMEEGIVEFSELGKFIDQPVKTYSSGMKSRLGFAISVNVNPDILIIDEALSVGDKTFSTKCLSKIDQFKKEGKTILFVSHSSSQIKEFCDKVLWLEYGKVKEFGLTDEVFGAYEKFVSYYQKLSNGEKKKYRENTLK
jgi:teichoic acid transport system ATP-binding protein